MTEALTGSPRRGATLTEQANGRRIGRSTFIGHSAGYFIVLVAIAIGFASGGFTQPGRYYAVFPTGMPSIDLRVTVLVPWLALGLTILGAIIWTDLGVRRRHDRGRSGVDVVVFQMLLLASVIIHCYADAPDIVGWLDAALVLYGLYLLVVLVMLPGDKDANRFGPRP